MTQPSKMIALVLVAILLVLVVDRYVTHATAIKAKQEKSNKVDRFFNMIDGVIGTSTQKLKPQHSRFHQHCIDRQYSLSAGSTVYRHFRDTCLRTNVAWWLRVISTHTESTPGKGWYLANAIDGGPKMKAIVMVGPPDFDPLVQPGSKIHVRGYISAIEPRTTVVRDAHITQVTR